MKLVDKKLYKKAKEYDEEVTNFIMKKRVEERELFEKNRKEINDFENIKKTEKQNFCVESGGHFFGIWMGYETKEYVDDEIIYLNYCYRVCDLCNFHEKKYDIDDIGDVFWEE